MAKYMSVEEILAKLKDGGTVRYFYLDGGVAFHNGEGNPIGFINITDFLQLRSSGQIVDFGKKDTGYPHCANNRKCTLYKLS